VIEAEYIIFAQSALEINISFLHILSSGLSQFPVRWLSGSFLESKAAWSKKLTTHSPSTAAVKISYSSTAIKGKAIPATGRGGT
jgi:hypothetical protein